MSRQRGKHGGKCRNKERCGEGEKEKAMQKEAGRKRGWSKKMECHSEELCDEEAMFGWLHY